MRVSDRARETVIATLPAPSQPVNPGAGFFMLTPESLTIMTPGMSKPKQGSEIEHIPPANLIPYARNSRTHSPDQVAQIAGSIREFGFTNPVLIDADDGIIAGHGRVMGAQKLGLETVPCIRLSHLTETQKRAYIIADNKLALNAGWDDELLGLELSDLREYDFDLGLLGFDAFAIEQFLNPPERDDTEPESSGGEIDVEGMQMECACPKCGFEFDPKKK